MLDCTYNNHYLLLQFLLCVLETRFAPLLLYSFGRFNPPATKQLTIYTVLNADVADLIQNSAHPELAGCTLGSAGA